MKVLYTKDNNHFIFYSSHNKFLTSTLLILLEKNPRVATDGERRKYERMREL